MITKCKLRGNNKPPFFYSHLFDDIIVQVVIVAKCITSSGMSDWSILQCYSSVQMQYKKVPKYVGKNIAGHHKILKELT